MGKILSVRFNPEMKTSSGPIKPLPQNFEVINPTTGRVITRASTNREANIIKNSLRTKDK